MNASHLQAADPKSVVGRLAKRPYQDGDALPEVGAMCLVAGANTDMESDQHRSYLWVKVVGYTQDNEFVCLQKPGHWPTVERLTNCWFADEESLAKAAALDLLAAAKLAKRYLTADSTPLSNSDVTAELGKAIAKAEGRTNV